MLMECKYAIPAAISLAKDTFCSHDNISEVSCNRALKVPPDMYSVTKCSFLSL